WAPTPPPHAAAKPVICHGPPYRLLMLLSQADNLKWAPVPPPHAACQVPECVPWVPVRLTLLLSLSPHSAMCHFQASSHCRWVSIFVIGWLYGLPLLELPDPTATLWLHTLVLAP
ncbi:unnamed protein product, partial [Staurois parvus]